MVVSKVLTTAKQQLKEKIWINCIAQQGTDYQTTMQFIQIFS